MLGVSINFNFNNFNCNQVVKISKNYHFWAQLVQKRGHYGPCPKRKTNFFTEITSPDHQLSKAFYFIKISYASAEL